MVDLSYLILQKSYIRLFFPYTYKQFRKWLRDFLSRENIHGQHQKAQTNLVFL